MDSRSVATRKIILVIDNSSYACAHNVGWKWISIFASIKYLTEDKDLFSSNLKE